MADAYKSSPAWVKRMEEFFVQSDLNHDGYLSIEDFDIWSDNLEREASEADPVLLQKARKATRELWESAGLKPGVFLTKEQFVDNMAKVSISEVAKHREGKESLFFNFIETVFDVVDTNNKGYLDLKDYELMMRVSNFDAGTAKMVFDIIDANHDGKLSREELRVYNIKFWFTPDSPEAAGLYGLKFE